MHLPLTFSNSFLVGRYTVKSSLNILNPESGFFCQQEVAVKKFLDQDFSGAALDEFKREVRTCFP